MNVTAEEIISLLPLVADRGFRVNADGEVRDRQKRCPICALAFVLVGCDLRSMAWTAMERMIGSLSTASRDAVDDVASAADHRGNGKLRNELLLALGL